ncbi:MAG: T9SS type A sorting domain-containing protein [Bacteroidia bacterium]|nr:T9SS type A sorting domain-containing protein [Bacteroidia bacterium]
MMLVRLTFLPMLLFPVLLDAQPLWVDEGGPYGGSIVEIMKSANGFVALPSRRTFVLLGSHDARQWVRSDIPDGDAVANGLFETDGRLLVGGDGRVFLSDDGGVRWRTRRVDWEDASDIRTIIRHGGDLFAANYSYLYRSTNNGEGWSKMSGTVIPRTMVSLGAWLLAGDAGGVQRSSDHGSTWQRYEGLSLKPLRLHAAPQGTVLLSTQSGSGVSAPTAVIYRSVDSGFSWHATMLAGQNVNDITWSNGRWSVATGTGVFHSDDDGVHWTRASAITPYARAVLSIEASGDTLLAGVANLGLWQSIGGGEWTYVSHGVFPIGVANVVSTAEGLLAHSLKDNQIYMRDAQSGTWDMRHYPVDETPMGFLFDRGRLYLSNTGALLMSSDLGRSWERNSAGWESHEMLGVLVRSGEYLIVSINGFGIARSKTGTGDWEHVRIWDFWQCFDFLDVGDALYAGHPMGLFISRDHGATWDLETSGGFPTYIYRLAFANGLLIAAAQNGVHTFDPSLSKWRTVYGKPAFAVAATGAGVFALTRDDRVIRLSPDFASYEPYSQGIPPASFVDPTVCRAELKEINGRLYLGACSLPGLFSLDLTSITTADFPAAQPAQLRIHGTWPSPAGSTFSVEWSGPQSGTVHAEVLDVLGRTIRTHTDEMRTSGRQTMTIDTRGMSSGVYYLRLRSGGEQALRRVLVH